MILGLHQPAHARRLMNVDKAQLSMHAATMPLQLIQALPVHSSGTTSQGAVLLHNYSPHYDKVRNGLRGNL